MKSEKLHQRLSDLKARSAIRKWEMRQMHQSRGVWFRLEQLLAATRCAFAITPDQVAHLSASGFEPHPAGLDLEPHNLLFVLTEDACPWDDLPLVALQDFQQIVVAPALILVPFPSRLPA